MRWFLRQNSKENKNTLIVNLLVPYNQCTSQLIGRCRNAPRSLESPLKRLPGLLLSRLNEAQGWCAVCRDPRLEDSFQARACIDGLKEVSAASVQCGADLHTL